MKLNTVLVDRYQICEKLGYAKFLAQDLHSQDLVVIEILQPDSNCYEDDLQAFKKEAAALQRLDHSAIPKYLDYFEVKAVEAYSVNGLALVQTYIEAPSLEWVVKDGRKFSETEAIELADRLLSILIYLHEQDPQVIHQNIRPSSILLTSRSDNSIGNVYLVNFGSAQEYEIRTRCTMLPDYYQLIGMKCYPQQDLYSLGVTIICLLTGTEPWKFINYNETMKFTVEFSAEISKEFHRWLEKIADPDPRYSSTKRFDSAQSAQISLRSRVQGIYAYFISLLPML